MHPEPAGTRRAEPTWKSAGQCVAENIHALGMAHCKGLIRVQGRSRAEAYGLH